MTACLSIDVVSFETTFAPASCGEMGAAFTGEPLTGKVALIDRKAESSPWRHGELSHEQRFKMAQLIVIPIDEETDAVLIVILREDQPLIGYVTKFTLESFFHCDLTAHDCVRLVDSKIDFFEQILAAKSLQRQESKTPCIQVELSDLRTNWEGNR